MSIFPNALSKLVRGAREHVQGNANSMGERSTVSKSVETINQMFEALSCEQ